LCKHSGAVAIAIPDRDGPCEPLRRYTSSPAACWYTMGIEDEEA
jgi:hypothetical protein